MTENREDYLKVIFKLQERSGGATNKEISQWLGITPASVTEMTAKLRKAGMVQSKNGHIGLTEMGLAEAKRILSIHRLWETFLEECLGYSWRDVHACAELLEHVTSDDLMEKLNDFLGRPAHCPHGDVIYINGERDASECRPLSHLEPGNCARVLRVSDDETLLNYLDARSIGVDTVVKVLEIEEFDHDMLLAIVGEGERHRDLHGDVTSGPTFDCDKPLREVRVSARAAASIFMVPVEPGKEEGKEEGQEN